MPAESKPSLEESVADLKRGVRAELVRWGMRGLIIRLVMATIALELIFVVIPWAWSRYA